MSAAYYRISLLDSVIKVVDWMTSDLLCLNSAKTEFSHWLCNPS